MANLLSSSGARNFLKLLLLFAVYFVSAKLGLKLAFVNASATAVWPPTGIALAAFLILGTRVWPVIFLGAFLVNFTTAGTVWTSLGIASGNTLEGIFGAYLIQRFANGLNVFERAKDILKFALLAGVLATLISPTIGVGSLCLGGFAAWASYGNIWLTWWLGDMTGALLVTPFFLLWARRPQINLKRVPEILANLLVILLIGQAVFGGWFLPKDESLPLSFLGTPLLLWTAFRYGPRETALGGVLLSAAALWNTLARVGPFGGLPPDQALLVLQSFAAVTSISSLALAAAISERNLAETNLEKIKRAEEEIQNQSSLMRSIINNMGEGLLVCNEKGKTILLNPAAEVILGGQIGDPLPGSSNLKNVVSSVEGGPALTPDEFPITRALKGEASDNVELFIKNPRKPQGIHILTTSRPIRDAFGAIRGGVSVFRDITDQKKAYQKLKDSEERFRLLVNNVKDYAIFLLDAQGMVMTWNDGAQRLKGYQSAAIVGRHFSCFYTQEDIDRGRPRELLKIAEEEGRADDEGWRVREDGSRFWADVVITALRDEKGTLKGFAKITRDITQKKKMDELARSNRELEQFAYVASHDLQEPLRMVASFVQLLAMDYKGKLDSTADQYIQEVVDGVKRMQALILDLLAYSRLDSGGQPFGKVDCGEALKQTLSNLEVALKESGAKVFPSAMPIVKGDFNQIAQLFQNLIANAVKFRAAAPCEIQVEAVLKDGEWLFCVRDNGIGLDPKYADQIFEIFKRLHTRWEYPGTGIGLAICKKVVTRHGGRIWVESKLGQGAAFYWTMPVMS